MLFGKKKYNHLIIKMIQGEASPEEQRIAQKWIESSAENRKVYENYRNLLLLTDTRKVTYDADKAWEKLHARINASNQGTAPGRNPAKRSRQIKRYAAVSGIAAMFLMAIGLFSVLNKQPEALQLSSGQTVIEDFRLPDGSMAALNENTVIKYPEWFSGQLREIAIFGEAFFEIEHNKSKPFVIHASGIDIKVVGTSFVVEARPDNDFVKVIVNTGKVLVYRSGLDPEQAETSGQMLTAGEIATYSRETGQIVRGVNDNLNYMSWKTGVVLFNETRMSEVIKALGSKYNVSFIVNDPDLLNQRLTARFEKESLDQALETLRLIFKIDADVQDSKVYLSPSGQ